MNRFFAFLTIITSASTIFLSKAYGVETLNYEHHSSLLYICAQNDTTGGGGDTSGNCQKP